MNERRQHSVGLHFVLPKGLLDAEGKVHREGMMREVTGRDEIEGDRHPTRFQYPAYRVLVMLSQTLEQLGEILTFTPETLEQLFIIDLTYLLNCYNSINPPEAQLSLTGESPATP